MKQKKRFETEIEWSLKVLNPGAKKSLYKDITILRGFKTIRGEETNDEGIQRKIHKAYWLLLLSFK